MTFEERRWERRKVSVVMHARCDSGEDVGVITEFGIKGLCIRGARRLAIGELLTLRIDPPATLPDMSPFVVEVECRWSEAQDDEGVYDSGVRFRVDSAQQLELVRKVLETCTSI